jgi:hypothetical protein
LSIGKLFVNASGHVRNGWWVAIFLGCLAAILFPSILLSARFHHTISLADQAVMIAVATLVCQGLRRRSIQEVTGRFGLTWLLQLGAGMAAGAVLMAAPALVLLSVGAVHWQFAPVAVDSLLAGVATMAVVAIAEELLFRGFVFQRLVDGIGSWPAQLIVAGMFLLTHLNNPGMTGAVRMWAGINIFCASILFGLAFLKTRSLAMPLGLHFMANVLEGPILGLGVSGNGESGLLKPSFSDAPQWLTGGAFGLEASLPGLICVLIGVALLWRAKPARDAIAVPRNPVEE